jgi:hypothetical protein
VLCVCRELRGRGGEVLLLQCCLTNAHNTHGV